MSNVSLKQAQLSVVGTLTLTNAMSPINCNDSKHADSSCTSSKSFLDELKSILGKRSSDMASIIRSAKEKGAMESLEGRHTSSRLPFVYVGGGSNQKLSDNVKNYTRIQPSESTSHNTDDEGGPLSHTTGQSIEHNKQRFLAPGVSFLKIKRFVPNIGDVNNQDADDNKGMKHMFAGEDIHEGESSSSMVLEQQTTPSLQKNTPPPPTNIQPSNLDGGGGAMARLKDILLVDDYLLDSMNTRTAPTMSHRIMKANSEVRFADKNSQNKAKPTVIDSIEQRSTLGTEMWLSNITKPTNSKIIFEGKLDEEGNHDLANDENKTHSSLIPSPTRDQSSTLSAEMSASLTTIRNGLSRTTEDQVTESSDKQVNEPRRAKEGMNHRNAGTSSNAIETEIGTETVSIDTIARTNPLSQSSLMTPSTEPSDMQALSSSSPFSIPEEHAAPFNLSDLKQILFFFILMVQGQAIIRKVRTKKKRRVWMSKAKALDEAEEIRIQAIMETARIKRKEARERAEREAALVKEREEELLLAQQEADRQYIEEQAAQLQAREEELLKAEELVAKLMVKEVKSMMEKKEKLRRKARREATRTRFNRENTNIQLQNDAARLKATEDLCIRAVVEAAAAKKSQAVEDTRRKMEVESAWRRLVESEPFSTNGVDDSVLSSTSDSLGRAFDTSNDESLVGIGIISSDDEPMMKGEGKVAIESDEETLNRSNELKRKHHFVKGIIGNEEAEADVLNQAFIRLKATQDERRKREEEKNGHSGSESVRCFWTDEETHDDDDLKCPNVASSVFDVQNGTTAPVEKKRVLQIDGGEAVWWDP